MKDLNEIILGITDLDAEHMKAAQERQNTLTKPAGSLGVLEQISIRLAGMARSTQPEIRKKTVIVMAGDHGITEEGVSAYPSDVTAQMVYNFAAGGAAVNVLAKEAGADVVVVDVGVNQVIDHKRVIAKKVRPGTANMTKGPAMTREEALAAIFVGVEVAEEVVAKGASLIATGDMGIGNTSASSAIISILGSIGLEDIVGRGTGVDDEGLDRKLLAIRKAINVNKPQRQDPLDVLHKVGGLEIAGLSGVILACARRRTPVVIDGFISSAAALLAAKIAPKSVNYMIASHLSAESGHSLALAEVGLTPMLHMNMRLGEGTGAVIAMNIIHSAAKLMRDMATFEEASVSGEISVEKIK